jgi:hypothetical protein
VAKDFQKILSSKVVVTVFFLRILTDQTFERVRKEHCLWKSESETQFYPIPKLFDQQRKIVAVKLHGFVTRGKTLERTLNGKTSSSAKPVCNMS